MVVVVETPTRHFEAEDTYIKGFFILKLKDNGTPTNNLPSTGVETKETVEERQKGN